MKSFKEFLTESAKNYTFRIKIAGDVSQDQADHIKGALAKWGVENFTKPKRTPVQEQPADFPMLNNIEVSIIDATLNYPATPLELQTIIHSYCGFAVDHIKVFNENDPNEAAREEELEEKSKPYEVKLTSPYPKSEKNLPYGDKHTKEFLKDLKSMSTVKLKGSKAKTSNDDPVNTKSPVGSVKTNRPTPKSFSR